MWEPHLVLGCFFPAGPLLYIASAAFRIDGTPNIFGRLGTLTQ